MIFAQAADAEYPPYLLDFAGSPGERHVENLKVKRTNTSSLHSHEYLVQILREVGLSAYNKAAGLMYGPDYTLLRDIEDKIQDKFVGPDCYWKNPAERPTPGCTKFFGNAWWIPFPPTLVRGLFICFRNIIDLSQIKVIRYDDGPLKALREMSDLKLYVTQNISPDVQRKRRIRMALRALDGERVTWSYVHTQVSLEMIPQ
jgi:hypothetical protein